MRGGYSWCNIGVQYGVHITGGPAYQFIPIVESWSNSILCLITFHLCVLCNSHSHPQPIGLLYRSEHSFGERVGFLWRRYTILPPFYFNNLQLEHEELASEALATIMGSRDAGDLHLVEVLETSSTRSS